MEQCCAGELLSGLDGQLYSNHLSLAAALPSVPYSGLSAQLTLHDAGVAQNAARVCWLCHVVDALCCS